VHPGRRAGQAILPTPAGGVEGISVFDAAAVDPPLTDGEILHAFRSGSVLVVRSITTLAAAGLTVVPTPGASHLPPRLQLAHAEIRPGPAMTRPQFKRALRSLE